MLIVNNALIFIESEFNLLQNFLDSFRHIWVLIATHAPEIVAAIFSFGGDAMESTQMKTSTIWVINRAFAGLNGTRPN
jgi:phosphohistidine phosphatase SixA